MSMKNNDFIVAAINNPGFGPADFRAAGMDSENTQILSKDEYLKSDYIKTNDAFKDANGDFSEKKFSDFYDYELSAYQTFSKIDDGFQYDQFDARRMRDDNAQVKSQDMVMYQISNPDEVTIGQGFVNQAVQSPFSTRELAEQNSVYDTATDTFCTYTPNEHALFSDPIEYFKDLFKEPLVLATYDEEGFHEDPMSGQLVEHKKGQPKINSDGKYFYETLNGRSLAGKQVLSKFDTLTVDGDSLNQFDFFDSDEKEKSIGGSIMKGVATVAPLFMGPVGTVLATAQVLREFGKVMPMVDGMLSAVTGTNTDTAFSKWANNWTGRMTSITQSVSDYSQQNMFSLENFANLASDVALQWGQQQQVAKGFAWLRGNRNIMEKADDSAYILWQKQSEIQRATMAAKNMPEAQIVKAIGNQDTWKASMLGRRLLNQERQLAYKQLELTTKMGQDASLAYMALISNPDVYTTMLEHGTTKREAAFVTLASTVGMFSVDKFLHLGEMFFDEANDDMLRSIRATLAREAGGPDGKSGFLAPIASIVRGGTTNPTEAKGLFRRLVSKFHDEYTKFWQKAEDKSLGFFGKAIGEGLEEVSEELSTDMSKQLYELAASWQPTDRLLNDLTTDNVGAFSDPGNNKNWFKDLFARYSINFLGGLMGGGIFYMKGAFDRGNFQRDISHDNLIDNVYMYGKDEVMKVLDKFHKRGALGSTKLSMEYQMDEKGNRVFLSANEGESQNDIVYNNIKNSIDGIDRIINDKEIIRSDSEMINQLTLGDARFQLMSSMLGNDYTKGLRQQAQNLVHDYVKANQQIEQIEKEILTADSNITLRKKKEGIRDKLQEHAENLKKQLDQFKSGELAFDYMNEVLFNMDDRISSAFLTPNFTTWLSVFKKNQIDGYDISPMTVEQFNKLSQKEQDSIRNQYREYIKSKKKDDAHLAYQAFKFIRDITREEIDGLNDVGEVYQNAINAYQELKDETKNPILLFAKDQVYSDQFSETASDDQFRIDWNTQYDFETDEDFANRDKFSDETDEHYAQRRAARIANIQTYLANERNNNNFIDALKKVEMIISKAGYLLDNTTRRQLKLFVGLSQKEIIQRAIQNNVFQYINPAAKSEIEDTLQQLPNDMNTEDVKTVMDNIRKIMLSQNAGRLQAFINMNTRLLDFLYNSYNIPTDASSAFDFLYSVIKNVYDNNYRDFIIDALENIGVPFDGTSVDEDVLMEKLNEYLQELDEDEFKSFVSNPDPDIQKVVSALYNALKSSKGSKDVIQHLLDNGITAVDEILTNEDLHSYAFQKLKDMLAYKSLTDTQKNLIRKLINPNFKKLSYSQVEKIRAFFAKAILDVVYTDNTVNIEDLTEEVLDRSEYGDIRQMVDLIIRKNDDTFDAANVDEATYSIFSLSATPDGKAFVVDTDKFFIYADSVTGAPSFDFFCRQLNRFIGAEIFTADFLKATLSDKVHKNSTGGYYVNAADLDLAVSSFEGENIKSALDPQVYLDEDLGGNAPDATIEYSESGAFKSLYDQDLKQVDDFIDLFIKGIKENSVWNYLDKLNNTRPIQNPIVDVLNKLNGVMGNPVLNVERLLDDIDKLRDSQGYQEFNLKPTQIEELQDAFRLLSLARSLMYASYDSSNFQNPFPHNKTMNDVIRKNRLKIDLFPILNPEVAQTFIYSISEIMATIGEYDPSTGTYTSGSILEWNRLNGYNKKAALIKSKEADIKSHLQFYANNKDNFKSDDGSIDLSHVIDSIIRSGDSQEKKIYDIQSALYNCVQGYLASNPGKTVADFFDAINIKAFIDSDKSTFINQSVASLNGELSFGQLTPLDKIMICLTDCCMSIKSRKQFQADFVASNDDFASLSNQEIISEKGIAYIDNPVQFQAGLDWAYKHYKDVMPSDSTSIKQALLYAVVMTGNGGAGKTDVCIRQQLEYAKYKKGFTDKQIFVSGPTQTQINNLSKLGVGQAQSIDEILKQIYGETLFNEIVAEMTAPDSGLKHLAKLYDRIRVIDSSKAFTYESTEPRVIVVDEASWIDSVRLSMLSQYAKDTGAALILVGDDYQSGYQTNGNDSNFNPEIFFTGRTPRLSITLRDCNIQKYNNTLTSAKFLNSASNIFIDDPDKLVKRKKWIQTLLSDYSFTYFEGDVINGDMVVSSLSDDIINKLDLQTKLKNDGTRIIEKIAYIGSNDSILAKLKAKFGDDMVEQYKDVQSIQGNEFSNIIIDMDVRQPNVGDDKVDIKFNALNAWVQKINTLSTRGKNAAIFIDSTGELSAQLHNMKDPMKNNKSNFDKDAIKAFNDNAKASFTEFGITGSDYKATTTTTTAPSTSTASSTSTSSTSGSPAVVPTTRFAKTDEEIAVLNSEDVDEQNGASSDEPSMSLSAFAQQDASESDPVATRGEGRAAIWANSALVYGDNTISGMPYEIRETSRTVNGKSFTQRERVYSRSNSNNTTFYDVDAFAQMRLSDRSKFTFSEVEDVEDGNESTKVFSQYNTLKLAILHRVDANSPVLDGIVGNEAGCIMSKADYLRITSGKNIHIEVSAYDEKRFNYINMNHLSEDSDRMAIAQSGSTPLVITLVAEYGLGGSDTGKRGKITLGFFADPRQFEAKQSDIKKRLQAKIDRGGFSELEVKRMKNYISALDSDSTERNPVKKYRSIIDNLASQFTNASRGAKTDGEYSASEQRLSLPADGVIRFSGQVGVYNNIRNVDGTVPELRLSNLDAQGNRISRTLSFKEVNRGVTFSGVYVFRKSMNQNNTAADNGRCCVFVTTDPSLNPSELCDVWCNQQMEGYRGKHTVRMIKLNNAGVTWSDLVNFDYRNLYKTYMTGNTDQEQKMKRIPFASDIFAIRQIIALQNWRADISAFRRSLDLACNKGGELYDFFNSYAKLIEDSNKDESNSFIKQALVLLHESYVKWNQIDSNKTKTETDFQQEFANASIEGLDSHSDVFKLAVAINKFNNSLDNQCRRFRLGIGNVTSGERGQTSIDFRGLDRNGSMRNMHQIRRLNVSEHGLYANEVKNGTHVYGIYLTPDLFNQFDESTTEIYNIIEEMGVQIKSYNGDTHEESDIDEDRHIERKQIIDGKEVSTVVALFKNLENAGNGLRISNDPEAQVLLRKLPTILLRLGGRAHALRLATEQTDSDGKKILVLPEDTRNPRSIGVRRIVKKGLWESQFIPQYKVQDGKLVEDKEAASPKTVSVKNSVDMGDNFNLMMELCFHGTTMNVVESNLRRRQHKVVDGERLHAEDVEPHSTDAEFGYGFLIDPQARSTNSQITTSASELRRQFVPTTAKPYMFTVAARIAAPTITIEFGHTPKIDEETKESSTESAPVMTPAQITAKSSIDTLTDPESLDKKGSIVQLAKTIKNNVNDFREGAYGLTVVYGEDVDESSLSSIPQTSDSWKPYGNAFIAAAASYEYKIEIEGSGVKLTVYKPESTSSDEQSNVNTDVVIGNVQEAISNFVNDEEKMQSIVDEIGIEPEDLVAVFEEVSQKINKESINGNLDIYKLLYEANEGAIKEILEDGGESIDYLKNIDVLSDFIDELNNTINDSLNTSC